MDVNALPVQNRQEDCNVIIWNIAGETLGDVDINHLKVSMDETSSKKVKKQPLVS